MSFLKFFSKSNKSVEELMREGCYQEALGMLEEKFKVATTQEDHEHIPPLLRQTVQCLLELGETERAVARLCTLGEYFTNRGFHPKAVATFKKALKLKPDSAHLMERIAAFNNKVPKYFINTQEAQVLLEQSELVRRDNIED